MIFKEKKGYSHLFKKEYITKKQVKQTGAVWLEDEQMWGIPSKRGYSGEEFELLRTIRMQDPEYRKWREDGEKRRKEMHEKIDAESAEYLEDLKKIGISVPEDRKGFWTLRNDTSEVVEQALPVIMKYLRKEGYHRQNVESLLYTLAHAKKHPELADELLDLFVERHELGSENTWARCATAVEIMGTKENVDKIISILETPSLEKYTNSFVATLSKLAGKKDERVKKVLLKLLQSEQADNKYLIKEVIIELRKMKCIEAYDVLLPFVTAKEKYISKEAKKAIKSFDIIKERQEKRGKK